MCEHASQTFRLRLKLGTWFTFFILNSTREAKVSLTASYGKRTCDKRSYQTANVRRNPMLLLARPAGSGFGGGGR